MEGILKNLELTYDQFPHFYSWQSKNHLWKRRKNYSKRVGRLPVISPASGEAYYLRALLHNISGCANFDSLRTVDGNLCATFQEAAVRHGLIKDDKEWERCMQEQSLLISPYSLRGLFLVLLENCNIADPLKLWNTFKAYMARDFCEKRLWVRVSRVTVSTLVLYNWETRKILESKKIRVKIFLTFFTVFLWKSRKKLKC